MQGRPPRMSGRREIRLPISVTVAIASSIPPSLCPALWVSCGCSNSNTEPACWRVRSAAFGAAEGDVDDRALPRHPGCQRADFIERDIGAEAYTAFAGAARDGMLDAVARIGMALVRGAPSAYLLQIKELVVWIGFALSFFSCRTPMSRKRGDGFGSDRSSLGLFRRLFSGSSQQTKELMVSFGFAPSFLSDKVRRRRPIGKDPAWTRDLHTLMGV